MKNRPKEKTTPLAKHKRDGKKLTPPFLQIPKLTTRSWINDALPEMLWAVLLITQLERKEALGLFRGAVDFLSKLTSGLTVKEIKFHPTITGFSLLKEKDFLKLIEILTEKKKYRKTLVPLLFYKDLPNYDKWAKFIKIVPTDDDWKILRHAVLKTLWHQSQEATDCRWITVYFEVKSGRLRTYQEMEREILGFPNVGDMRKVRPTIRAAEIGGFSLRKINKKWATYFWNESLKLTSCEGVKKDRGFDKGVPKKLVKRINQDYSDIFHKFFRTLQVTSIDAKRDTVYGLVLYAWRLFTEIVFARTNKMILGRLGLRSLAECYIILSYLIKEDKNDLWKEYRSYGVGQAKLAYLKFEELGETPHYFDKEAIKKIINEDVWVEFVPVNLGHWDNLDLRKISEKTNTKDVYDKYCSWLSNYSHGQWGVVRETVFQTCLNPLHRLHSIPLSQDKVFLDATDDAVKLFDLVLTRLNEVYPLKTARKK